MKNNPAPTADPALADPDKPKTDKRLKAPQIAKIARPITRKKDRAWILFEPMPHVPKIQVKFWPEGDDNEKEVQSAHGTGPCITLANLDPELAYEAKAYAVTIEGEDGPALEDIKIPVHDDSKKWWLIAGVVALIGLIGVILWLGFHESAEVKARHERAKAASEKMRLEEEAAAERVKSAADKAKREAILAEKSGSIPPPVSGLTPPATGAAIVPSASSGMTNVAITVNNDNSRHTMTATNQVDVAAILQLIKNSGLMPAVNQFNFGDGASQNEIIESLAKAGLTGGTPTMATTHTSATTSTEFRPVACLESEPKHVDVAAGTKVFVRGAPGRSAKITPHGDVVTQVDGYPFKKLVEGRGALFNPETGKIVQPGQYSFESVSGGSVDIEWY